jgi:pimeloyl-ACP methyl ester carboxylesterase
MQDRISNTTPGWRGYAVRTGAALLALLAIAYAGAGWYLWANQRELIYLPTRDVRQTPAAVGLEYEEVWVPIPSGQPAVLNGWWLRSGDAAAPTFLYLHGNDFNLGANVEHVARLNRLGYAVLAVDYRGYGKSVGAFPSETQLYEDAEAAWSYLVRERGVDPGRAIIYGHSLGGAVAIELALRHPEAAGLIAESAFTSMPEMAKFVYGMFPVDWLLNQRFDALAKVPMLRVPVLFIHGTADAEVPYAMSEHLFAAAAGSKWLTLVPGGGHEDSAKVGGSLYADAVRDFARRALAAR